MKEIVSVRGVLHRLREDGEREVLLMWRDPDSKHNRNMLQLPGGKMEAGELEKLKGRPEEAKEALLEAYRRELREETSRLGQGANPQYVGSHTHASDVRIVHHAFSEEVDPSREPSLSEEHITYTWVAEKELKELDRSKLLTPGTMELIEKALKGLRKKNAL